jgi:hypothetical protein
VPADDRARSPGALGGPRNGGVAARRAMVRWAGRMFRREWRQQLLVVALLVVAVTARVASITVGYNANPADDGEFGSANNLLTLDGGDRDRLATTLAAARRRFGTTEAIGHRSFAVPGGVERVDVRAQAPGGRFAGALLAVRRGHYPVGAARSLSPMAWPSCCGSTSARPRRSAAVSARWSASSRTRASSATSSRSSHARRPGRRSRSRSW